MSRKFKSQNEILYFASAIKQHRIARELTLIELEKKVNINRGQLSKFEAGLFKMRSKNFHKLCKYLKINAQAEAVNSNTLGGRLEQFARHSKKHRDAAERMLQALEQLI